MRVEQHMPAGPLCSDGRDDVPNSRAADDARSGKRAAIDCVADQWLQSDAPQLGDEPVAHRIPRIAVHGMRALIAEDPLQPRDSSVHIELARVGKSGGRNERPLHGEAGQEEPDHQQTPPPTAHAMAGCIHDADARRLR